MKIKKMYPNTIAYCKQILDSICINGDVAECGVYKGDNSYYYASVLEIFSPHKTLHLFDSFCGFPENSEASDEKFSDTSLEFVKSKLSSFENIEIYPGFFKDTLDLCKSREFCCAIIDCDLYSSYKDCLSFFSDKMAQYGVIVLDEYYSKKYIKAKKAVDEFLESNNDFELDKFHVEKNGYERWRLIRN